MSRLKRRLLTVWRDRLPTRLKLAYYASNGGTVSRKGVQPSWSYAGALPDGEGGVDSSGDPVVHPWYGLWLGPAYTNLLPSGTEDFSTWYTAGTATIVDGNVEFDNDSNARVIITIAGAATVGDTLSFSVELSGVDGEQISIEVDTGTSRITLSESYQRYDVVIASVTTTDPILRIIRRNADDTLSVNIRNPQLTIGPYALPYIPPGTSVVSAAGSTGGNGLSFDISGTQEVPDGVELWAGSDIAPDTNYDYFSISAETGAVGDRAEFTFTVAGAPVALHFRFGGQYHSPGASEYYTFQPGTYSYIVANDDNAFPGTIAIQCGTTWAGSTVTNISVQKLETVPESKSLAVRRALEGKPDGVELWDSPYAMGTGAVLSLSDGVYILEAGSGELARVVQVYTGLTNGDRYIVSVAGVSTDDSDLKIKVWNSDWSTNTGESWGDDTYKIITVTDGTLRVGVFEIDAGTSVSFTASVQALNPAITTVAALVTMGMGSGELVNATSIPVVSANNSAHGGLYSRKEASGIENSVGCWDGVTYLTKTGTWDRGEQHIKAVQTGNTGNFFRVGNKRYTSAGVEIDSEIQWSSWTAFDGSFDPEEYLRVALDSTFPMHLKGLEVWDKAATDAEILKRLRREVLK